MRDYKCLCHTRGDCKYHIVFIPKKRRKLIFGNIRKHLGEVFHDLARQKGVVIEEGHLMRDHVHMCLCIPPKYSVSTVVGFLKGKSAISIAKNFKGRQRNFNGEAFWARGFYVSTVGLDEDMVKEYIRNQEKNDVHRDHLNIGI
jgi:putative transposase